MSCLTKFDIKKYVDDGKIVISKQSPCDEAGGASVWRPVRSDDLHIGPNSVDMHLHPHLKVYNTVVRNCQREPSWPLELHDAATRRPLDSREHNPTRDIHIDDAGYVLVPGVLYLARTVERTYTPMHVPKIGGRSSTGRLGINIHQTAGFGDVGFDGSWTLELSVVHPVRVYPNQRVAQLWLFTASNPLADDHQYGGVNHGGRYQGQVDPTEYRGYR